MKRTPSNKLLDFSSYRSKSSQQKSCTHHTAVNFNGATVIDEAGREIPITEKMVQASLAILIQAWENSNHNA